MVLDIQIDYPSVQVLDDTRATATATPYGICIMLGSGTTTTNDKALVLINDVTDFDTKIGSTSVSRKYVESFFANSGDAGVRLYFYKVNTGTTPAVQADYIAAFTDISPSFNPGGILISPEYFETTTVDADILAFSNKLDTFCDTDNESYWISLGDLPLSVVNASTAITKVANLQSVKGNIVVYQPWYYNGTTQLLPSAAMAAIMLKAWSTGKYYTPPANIDYPIEDATALGYALTKADLTSYHRNGINALRSFPNYGIVAYDTITRSTTDEYFQINSVVCFKIVAYLIMQEMIPFNLSAIAGSAEILTNVEASLNRLLNNCWTSGYLAGQNQNEAFTVKSETVSLPPPNNAQLVFSAAIRPSYALHKIKIYLKNTLGNASA